MNVSLTPELEQFVSHKVGSGLYQTASEVVREGLRLLKERDEQRAELRREIARGLEQVEQGKVKPFTDEVVASVKARGRKRRAGRNGSKP